MKAFLLLLSLVLTCGVQAQVLKLDTDKTYFQQVKEWYQAAHNTTFQEVSGFYAGRCFISSLQNVPTGMLLGYSNQVDSSIVGPGFPPSSIVKMGLDFNGEDPSIFDSELNFEKNKKSIVNVMRKYWKNYSEVSNTSTLNFSYDYEPNNRFDERYDFKIYGEYIVMKISALISQEYVVGYKKAGEEMAYCYFFKKLGN